MVLAIVLALMLVASLAAYLRQRIKLRKFCDQELELQRLNKSIDRGIDGMGAALWEWSLEDDSIYLSDLFLKTTGYSRDELGTSSPGFFERFHKDDRSEVRRELRLYLSHDVDHCSIEARFLHRDGNYFWVYIQAVGEWGVNNEPLAVVGSFADITSKMEAEEERDRLFNLSRDMLSVGGYDGFLKQANPSWVRVLGWSRDELMSHPLTHFIHEDDRETTKEAWDLLRQGVPIEGLENRFRCRDGSYKWLSWGSFPYVDRELVFSDVRDITVKKEVEQQLLDYQDRLRSLSKQLALVEDRQRRELASAIHDGLAQQLFGIRAQMVLLKYPKKVKNLEEVIVQIISILDDTMADARSLSFELFPPVLYEVGLDAALSWLANNFTEKTGIACTSSCEGHGDELPEDLRSMAYQCVRELLANVNKHASADEVQITLNYVDQFLTVSVQDNGAGFDVSAQKNTRSRSDSTSGFGLFSIRERLRSADGRVLVDSKPGRGTHIFLSFPRYGELPSKKIADQGERLG
ncbi:MAG: PAS domain S-box-containing protein [Candidatus Krumholzibacteriia bacterium]|jgi:PAS domain S-box-containing protein